MTVLLMEGFYRKQNTELNEKDLYIDGIKSGNLVNKRHHYAVFKTHKMYSSLVWCAKNT